MLTPTNPPRKPIAPNGDPYNAGYAAGYRDIHQAPPGDTLIDQDPKRWFAGWKAGQEAARELRGDYGMKYRERKQA